MTVDLTSSGSSVQADALAESLVVTCARFTRSVSRLSPGDIPTAVWRTLAILDEHGAVRVSDLAVLNQSSQPSATGMVQRLEAEGDVVRVPDPTDRRASRVKLSPAGREHLSRLRAAAATVLAPKLASLRAPQVAELESALRTISHLTDDQASVSAEPRDAWSPSPDNSSKRGTRT